LERKCEITRLEILDQVNFAKDWIHLLFSTQMNLHTNLMISIILEYRFEPSLSSFNNKTTTTSYRIEQKNHIRK
jgi:hypothetical protein